MRRSWPGYLADRIFKRRPPPDATARERTVAGGARKRITSVAGPAAYKEPERPATVPAEPGAASKPRLIFILSTERSGSTLLSVALGAHHHHISPPEMHLMAYSTFDEWRREYPAALDSLRFLMHACGRDGHEEALETTFAGWTPESIYRWVVNTGLDPDDVFIDKTPKYARYPEVLARIETLRPHYIWLIRHPLAVAASQIELRRERRLRPLSGIIAKVRRPIERAKEFSNKPRLLADEVAYWREIHSNIETFLAAVDERRQCRVVFENFVREPETELRRLCEWLGTDFEPGMLDPGTNVPAGMGPLVGDPKLATHRRIDASVADAWRRRYSEDVLDSKTLTLMERWGVATADG
jgi:hypothetical protein